jgi:CubicO group peptidase (beta-lactamase class C family)
METRLPEDVGMSSERLARISALMEQYVKDNQMPGIMTLVQRKGKVVQFGKYGMMDIEVGKPMQENALFRIYSMTKPIVSVALMILFEEGRLSLNDPLSQYIPAFSQTKVDVDSNLVEPDPPIMIHHLLTHTAGLGYFGEPFVQRNQTLAEVVEQIAQQPLICQPWTQWSYSSASDVLGYVIQVIADMPLADFLEKRILKPLGMIDTSFHVPEEKLDRLAQIYESKISNKPIVLHPDDVELIGDVTVPTNCPSGGAGLVSTLGDYLNFCNCLINNGQYEGGRLLSRKTLAWMTANHMPREFMPLSLSPHLRNFGFGLGFRVTMSLGEARYLTSVGEYGWGGAAQTHFWIDPAEEFIGLMMSQHMSNVRDRVTQQFQDLAYQAIVD